MKGNFEDIALRLFSGHFSNLTREVEAAPPEMRQSLLRSLVHLWRPNGPMQPNDAKTAGSEKCKIT